MQEASFSGYFRVQNVGDPIPMNDTNRGGDPLYRVAVAATTSYGSYYVEGEGYHEDVREVIFDFTRLTTKSLRVLAPQAEILISNAKVYRQKVNSLYHPKVVNTFCGLSPENEAPVTADQIVDAICEKMGESHRDVIKNILPTDRIFLKVEVPIGSWSVKAHPAQIAAGQPEQARIEVPV